MSLKGICSLLAVVGELKHLGMTAETEWCRLFEGFCHDKNCPPPTSRVGSCHPEKRNCCKDRR